MDNQPQQFYSRNPANGELLTTIPALSEAELAEKITLAAETYQTYRQVPLAQRSVWLHSVADLLEQEQTHWATLMTLEMGKPLDAAIAEVRKCVLGCRYYADHAAAYLQDLPIPTDAAQSWVCYQPLGIILAVMPWNFPFWQVFRFAAPALMAGNVGLLKHASNVPQSAIAIDQIFQRSGFPQGVFQTLMIPSSQVAGLIADPRIQAATLTGSEAAGASLAMVAGANLKKVVLELGGSDPFIVLPSADLELAISTAVTARMQNNGQSCIAAKRFIAVGAIADEFEQGLLTHFQALKMGDPLDPETEIGPLATPQILAELDQLVQTAIRSGARVLTGGAPVAGTRGNFYPPTILAGLSPNAAIAQAEFFGPVALVFRVETLEAAIALANQIPFGLGASAWTQDPQEQLRLIQAIEAGSVFINGMVKSDPRLPFGGIKRSGYGRELGREGLLEFVNIKTVWVK